MTTTMLVSAPVHFDEQSIPIRRITTADLKSSLREGYSDFMEKRGDLFFVGLVYPFFGIPACVAVAGSSLPLLFPLAAGLSLLGPLFATGYYALARRREAGLEAGWRHFWDVVRSPQRDEIITVGAMLIGIFFLWLVAAAIIYTAFFGEARYDALIPFMRDVLTTPQGWGMIIVGNLAGLGFAILVLSISITSLPMLIDRRVDAGGAMRLSMVAYRQNRSVLNRWGMLVAALLVIGCIPMFVGLAVVFPILGYASWHLYTRLIDSSSLPPA